MKVMGLNLKNFIVALRAYSFTASVIPVIICFLIAKGNNGYIGWKELSLMLIGVISLHAATNLVNDYYDFIKGVDRKETKGSSRVLVEKLLNIREVVFLICFFYFIALAIGIFFVYHSGFNLVWFILAGVLGSFFYTAGGKPLKYVALGEIAVFLLMGPLLFLAIYFAFTAEFSFAVFLFSVPIGLQVTAILTANNIRDMIDDKKSGIKTLPLIIGKEKAIKLYYTEILSPFLIVLVLGINQNFLWITLILFPVTFRLMAKIKENYPNIVEATARLQMLFGILLSLAIFLGLSLG